jgi:MFS family permease
MLEVGRKGTEEYATNTTQAPGAHQLSTVFHVTLVQATYISTIAAFMPALSAFLWIPLSQRIGRRPVLLIGNLLTIVFTAALSQAQTYGQAVGFRVVAYFGGSVGGSIAPAAISEMFFLHEKGSRMGVYTFFFVAAPYLGGIAGGSIVQDPRLGWQWSQYIMLILYSFLFLVMLFCGTYLRSCGEWYEKGQF